MGNKPKWRKELEKLSATERMQMHQQAAKTGKQNSATLMMARRQKEFEERFLQSAGEKTISEICKAMGIHRATYEGWRRRDHEFRDRVDAIRMGHISEAIDRNGPDVYSGDFISFRKKFFGWDTYWHQRQIINAIETAKPGRIVMVNVPPEHGKTTVIEDYINYKLATDPNHRITYVHESRDFARKVLHRVTQRMTDSEQFPEYIARYGPFRDGDAPRGEKAWTADYVTVAKAKHDERDYSLQVRGVMTSVQGVRTDLLLIDDVQALKTLAQTEKIVNTLRQDYFSRPGKLGKIVMVGTRVGVNDVYEYMCSDPGLNELIDLICLPAIGENGEPLCPEMWNKEELELKRKLVGEDAWWRNYQQTPSKSGAQTFTHEMLDEAKDTSIPACVVPAGEPVILGLDPALGGGNALVACSYSRETLTPIDLKLEYGLARTEDILSAVDEFAARYRPLVVVIEIAAMQKGLARDDRLMDMSRRHGFRTVEHTTSRFKSDPVLGVGSMAGSFLRNEIRLPWSNLLMAKRLEPLIQELLAWRPDVPTKLLKQDTVMALWFAWKYWMEQRQTIGIDTSIWKFQGMPWNPTRKTI